MEQHAECAQPNGLLYLMVHQLHTQQPLCPCQLPYIHKHQQRLGQKLQLLSNISGTTPCMSCTCCDPPCNTACCVSMHWLPCPAGQPRHAPHHRPLFSFPSLFSGPNLQQPCHHSISPHGMAEHTLPHNHGIHRAGQALHHHHITSTSSVHHHRILLTSSGPRGTAGTPPH